MEGYEGGGIGEFGPRDPKGSRGYLLLVGLGGVSVKLWAAVTLPPFEGFWKWWTGDLGGEGMSKNRNPGHPL